MLEVSFQSSSVYSDPFLGGTALSLPNTAAIRFIASQHEERDQKLWTLQAARSDCEQVETCPAQALPATDDVTMVLLTSVLCLATELSTLLVPLTAGSIKSLCGSSTSMKKGDLHVIGV